MGARVLVEGILQEGVHLLLLEGHRPLQEQAVGLRAVQAGHARNAAVPGISKAQLADYVDSKGNFELILVLVVLQALPLRQHRAPHQYPLNLCLPEGNDEYNDFMAAVDTKPVTVTPGFSDTTIGILNGLAAGARELNRNPGVLLREHLKSQSTFVKSPCLPMWSVLLRVAALTANRLSINAQERS